MLLASVVAILIGLIATVVVVRTLYKHSVRKGTLKSKKDKVINGVIVGLVFFCVSSFSYVLIINI
ncbi:MULTISPECIES: hypothetical protein [Francisella]|uniref:Putative membrane protein n=1 Tax=Francisella philomiragia TaxID=28110 RepID=A0A0B6CWN5_9GAMM|nr:MULTISPECIES: hypothetical protein [Francisella]AJI53280.1 putative membrane protein [Francisella philomiragia]MBY7734059.1 hypothetical protein [Francisella philomiragia]